LLLDCRIVPKVLYFLYFILPDNIFGFIIYLHFAMHQVRFSAIS
jgi:hypothetical protein